MSRDVRDTGRLRTLFVERDPEARDEPSARDEYDDFLEAWDPPAEHIPEYVMREFGPGDAGATDG